MAKPKRHEDWRQAEKWPASKVELRPINWIKPYENNPRTHPPAQIELIASSMREDGVTSPILVDEEGVIIAGHGRRLAAIQNGYAEYPIVIARGWSDKKKMSVRLKDNSYAALSGWDKELVRGEIVQLQAMDYDVKLLGFGDTQLVQFTTLPGPPSQFPAVGADLHVDKQCPKCGYVGSGDWTPKAKKPPKPRAKKTN